jgi:hypothetical protein
MAVALDEPAADASPERSRHTPAALEGRGGKALPRSQTNIWSRRKICGNVA